MAEKGFPKQFGNANNWIENIYKSVDIDVENYKYPKKHKYIRPIVNILNAKFHLILNDITNFLGDQLYYSICSEQFQHEVCRRLENGILPNCIMNEHLNETPIDLRNIVNGTWQYICGMDSTDYVKFYRNSLNANRLSLRPQN